jgi:hypothetical protein
MATNHRFPDDEQLDLFDKMPPHNIEAEQGVLGSIFLDNSVLPSVREAVGGPDDFYRDAHQILYRVILSLSDQGKPIDGLTMADELTRLNLFRDIGGEDYLYEIIKVAPHAANAKFYAQIIRQKSVARGLIEVFDDGMRRAYSNEFTAEQLLEYARVEVFRVESLNPNWEEPRTEGPPRPPEFPIDVLPVAMQDLILRHAESLPCPPDYIAVPALAVAGAAMGRSMAITLQPTWRQYANLWSAVIGAPGSAKSPAQDVATRPARKINATNFEEYRDGAEAFKQAKRDRQEARKMLGRGAPPDDPEDRPTPPKRITVIDATAESLALKLRDNPRGVIMVRDELAGWVCAFDRYASGGGDRETFLSLWNNGSIMVDRKGQVDGVPIYVADTFFAVTGAMTPGRLHLLGTDANGESDGDGFFERFLLSYPPEILPRRTDEVDTTELDEFWYGAVKRLWDRQMIQNGFSDPRPFFLDFDPDAKAIWNAWTDRHCAEIASPDFPKHLTGAWSKFRNHAARLTLAVDQVRWAYDPTSPEYPAAVGSASAEAGVKLAEYFKAHFRHVLAYLRGQYGDNPDARDILAWCVARGELRFTEREVSANFRHRFEEKPTGSLGHALEWLENRHCIRKLPLPNRPGPGRRPSQAFEVNPLLLGSARRMRNIQ